MATNLPSRCSLAGGTIPAGALGSGPPREGSPTGAGGCDRTVMRTGPGGAFATVYLPFPVIRPCSMRPSAAWNKTVPEGNGSPLNVTVPDTEGPRGAQPLVARASHRNPRIAQRIVGRLNMG